jgi:N utilization substance protein B
MSQKPISENLSQKVSAEKAYPLRPTAVRRRAAARLACVQLGYSAELTGQSLQDAIPAFLENYAEDIARKLRVKKMDQEHFYTVVSGVENQKAEIEQMIADGLSDGWSIARLARTELVILRAAILELDSMPHVPARAVLSEYASIADAFNADVGFVNALLDRIARELRIEEMSADGKTD